ncbi:MAG: DNA polymerase I [Bacteroidales bacterium]|jgi:DNA polymerase-1|nr:DNA polymerase I [Bacteroidales bacterium]
MSEKKKKLFLIDAMGVIFRAYYALGKSPRITSKGFNTSAIFGFVTALYEVIKKEKPTHIGVAFDSHGPTIRHAEYEQYKAQRDNTPEDIIANLPYIFKILNAWKIPVLMLNGYEADDIIGTFAKKAEQEGFITYMMTSDKDYGQLVSDNIFVYRPPRMGNSTAILGVNEICQTYDIQTPEQLIDILGIWGDAVDNIPGIKGIGEVGAKKLIKQFGSIENMLANVESIESQSIKAKVKANAENALLSKSLATIMLDVPLKFDAHELELQPPDATELKSIFDELEFRTLEKRIFTDLSLQIVPQNQSKTNKQPDLFSAFDNTENQNNLPKKNTIAPKVASKYHTITKLENIPSLVQKILQSKAFSFYLPTHTGNPLEENLLGIAIALNLREAFYIPLSNNREQAKKFLAEFVAVFESQHILKITHDWKNAIRFLKKYNIYPKGNKFDTLLAHYLLDPDIHHHAIEDIMYAYLDNKDLYLQESDSFKDNVCQKADILLQLQPILERQLETKNALHLFENIEMPLVEILASMEDEGVCIDVPFLQEYSAVLQEKITQIQSEIYQMAGQSFNIASPKQLGLILFEKLQIIDNAKLTKSKQYQTGEEVLVKLEKKHPIVEQILRFRTLSKLKSTYVDSFPALVNPKTGRLHTLFNQAVTSTGRLSSSNPNLQNIPIRGEDGREIRKAFIPRNENYVLLSADYSQIELRLAAAMSEDENMLEAFKNGQDIHKATAARIYNIPPEEVTDDMRRIAKTVNFGILYGISAFGLSERLNIPRKEANELINQYFEKYPKIREYIDKQAEFATQNGYVETLMKRRRYLHNIKSANNNLRTFDQRNAVNAPVQGSAADLIKIAMIHIYNELRKRNLQSSILLQVHDELVLDVHKSELEEVKALVSDKMCNAMQLAVPLEIEINYGNNWLEAH